MFRLIRFGFRMIVALKMMAFAFSAGMGAAYVLQVRAQYRSWGPVKGGATRELAGDELVSQPDVVETRSLDIDAAPGEVWPWLAQMGYGRGGWYSYPALERPWRPGAGVRGDSADAVLPEFQDLAVGDLVPTHPEGGFEARVVDPGQALVLYLDDTMMREQIEQAMADRADDAEVDADFDLDMPPYAVSWAFVLEDAPGGRSRLIERLRARIEVSGGQRKAMPAVVPLMGMGVFAMMRSQMLGIKRRAEGQAGSAD